MGSWRVIHSAKVTSQPLINEGPSNIIRIMKRIGCTFSEKVDTKTHFGMVSGWICEAVEF